MKNVLTIICGIGFLLMVIGAAGFDSNMLAGGIMSVIGSLILVVCSAGLENYTDD